VAIVPPVKGREETAADFHETMAAGYGFEGEAVALGRPLAPGGEPVTDVEARIPLALLNRHGLITGATGTGKTKTLQLLAEQISAAGCPVFAADMKGDLAGIGAEGEGGGRVAERATQLGHDWGAAAAPVELLSLTGDGGVALRASVASFGPALLSKVLSLNDTQESSLGLVFRFCEDRGLRSSSSRTCAPRWPTWWAPGRRISRPWAASRSPRWACSSAR
jgi:hypothetical protein